MLHVAPAPHAAASHVLCPVTGFIFIFVCLRLRRCHRHRHRQMDAVRGFERSLSAQPPCVTEIQQYTPAGFPSACIDQQFASPSLPPLVPLVGAAAYIVSKPVLVAICAALDTTGKSYGFSLVCYLHNMALCLFSMVTCIRAVGLVLDSVSRVGVFDTYCGTGRSVLMQEGFSFYITCFYLSKCKYHGAARSSPSWLDGV
jgi:hypothetical protein